MEKRLSERIRSVPVLILVLIISGCALGPAPPIPPGLLGGGMNWIVVGLLVWSVILLWRNLNSNKTTRTDHLIDAINNISDRLATLEKKINQQEQDKEQQ